MKIKKYIILFFLLSQTLIYANAPVEVCTADSDWAPYAYYERDSSGEKTNKFIGASVDALNAISKKAGIEFNISGYNWKRCQKSVELFGKVKKFEAFMDGTSGTYREKNFLRTEAFYRTTLGVFYSKKRFPNGLSISTEKDLIQYNKVCGIHGQNYDSFRALGVEIDTGAKDISSVLYKLVGERCEVFPVSLETVFGAEVLGELSIPEDLHYTPIKEHSDNIFYFWISKQSPRAEQLLKSMNQAIQELKKDGEWESIYKRYAPMGSGL